MKKLHAKLKFKSTLGVLLSLSVAVSGCGGGSSRSATSPSNAVGGGSGGSTGGSSGGGTSYYPFPGSGSGTGSGSGGTTTGSTGSLPPLAFSFSLTGVGGSKPTHTTGTISTDSILKVRVTAGPAGQISAAGVAYSNFSATYNCVSYKLTVLGQTVQVGPLSTGSGYSYNTLCPNAQNSQVIDLSGRLTPGHGPVKITISEPYYDFYCNLLMMGWVYGTYQMFCPLHTVYKNHTVTGSLSVQVNGTTAP